MTYPALEVSFAPGVASSDVPTALEWVDITNRVLSLDIKYGREDEFSQPSAGTCDLEFDNATGLFDPDNTLGPYYGDLLPLTWLRVRGGASSVDTDLFYGQVSIEGWRLQASQFSGRMVVQITVVDMLEQLANTDLPSSVYAIEVAAAAPRAWYRLGESSGIVATDSSGNRHAGEYEGGATFNSTGSLIANDPDSAVNLDGVDDHVILPSTALPAATPYSFEFWISSDNPNLSFVEYLFVAGESNTSSALISFASNALLETLDFYHFGGASTANPYVQLTANTSVVDGGTHHVAVAVGGTAATSFIYVDGNDLTVRASTPGTLTMPGTRPAWIGWDGLGAVFTSATIDEFAIYDRALSPAEVESHYELGTNPWDGDLSGARIVRLLDTIGFPAPLRNIAAGDSTLQDASLGTDALSALQDIARAEGGYLYVDHADGGKVRFASRTERWTATRSITSQATLGDGSGEITYTAVEIDDDRIVNVATFQRSGGAEITVEDASSITQYQRRTFSETGLQFETDDEAGSRAALVVAEKKDRHRRARSVTLEPADPTHPAWPEVFARQIGDRVAVKWRPPYGGTYSFPSIVEGVGHSWRPADDAPWRTTFYFSPVPYGSTGSPYWILGTSTLGTDTRAGV